MATDLRSPDLEVYLPALREVPEMLDRRAEAARRCRNYAEDAYREAETGIGPGRTSGAGIINHLAGTHARIRDEVTTYFAEVRNYATQQGEKVRESVDLYWSTDMEVAATLDQSLWSIEAQESSADARARGRSSGLDPGRPEAMRWEPEEPADALRDLVDYRADLPFEPEWAAAGSPVGKIRDTIWQVTSWATELGICPRPYDVLTELVIPFTGDWAGMRSCGDALANLSVAAGRLNVNAAWIVRRVDAVWQGVVADAAFV